MKLLQGADVTSFPAYHTIALSGTFTIDDVPESQPVTILIESHEYLPARISLVPENDMQLGELIRRRLPPGVVPDRPPYISEVHLCVLLDDLQVNYADIVHMPVAQVEHVEILGDHGKLSKAPNRMIRVYTKRFLAAHVMGVESLPNIVYLDTGLGVVCK